MRRVTGAWLLFALYATFGATVVRRANVTGLQPHDGAATFIDRMPSSVCPGAKLTVSELAELGNKNCTVIEGSLELNVDPGSGSGVISPLESVVQITGSLLVSNLEEVIDSLGQILPNLAVIRSQPAFGTPHGVFGLYVYRNSHLRSIGLRSLTHILGNSRVLLWDNMALMFGSSTVDWVRLTQGNSPLTNDRGGGLCNKSLCRGSCWEENVCQQILPDDCYAVDKNGDCSCHSECLSKCYGPSARDCLACRHFYYNGSCVLTCPHGTYEHASWRCVDVCPDREMIVAPHVRKTRPTAVFNGACVDECPLNFTMDMETRTCIPCRDTCEKSKSRCGGGVVVRSLKDAEQFYGCKHVQGSLTISVFFRDAREYELLKMYLGGIERVDDYVEVNGCTGIQSLNFLQNLTRIEGINPWKAPNFYYGLVVTNNHNLRYLSWDRQKNLTLGAGINLKVLVMQNPWLCFNDLEQLRRDLRWTVHDWNNGYRGTCHPIDLNASISHAVDCRNMQWDPVPETMQQHLIGYNLLWTSFDFKGDDFAFSEDEEFDEQNPGSCTSLMWKFESMDNRTEACLAAMVKPWTTVAVQIRARFSQPNMGARTKVMVVHGKNLVPSCPTVVRRKCADSSPYSVTVMWSPPTDYSDTVTDYIIIAVEMGTGDSLPVPCTAAAVMVNGSYCQADAMNRTDGTCFVSNAPNIARNVTVSKDVCSRVGDGGVCEAVVDGLTNFRKYYIEIRARNAGGCSLLSHPLYFRTAKAHTDIVSNLSVVVHNATESMPFAQMAHVEWQPPKMPNGVVHSYQLRLEYNITVEEGSAVSSYVVEQIYPRYNAYDCSYKLGMVDKFIMCQGITKTSLDLPLFRVFGRRHEFIIQIRVLSDAGLSNMTVEAELSVDPVYSALPTSEDGNTTAIIASTIVVCIVLMLVVVGLLLHVTRLHKRKRQLRRSLKHQMKLSVSRSSGCNAIIPRYERDEWEIDRDHLVLEKELGKGAFGLVFLGKWYRRSDKEPVEVAVKTLADGASYVERMTFLREASIMKQIHSEDIVKLLGIVSVGSPVLVAMELMSGGDLKQYLQSLRSEGDGFMTEKFPLSEDCVMEFAAQIAAGMEYLSSMKLVHRDLATRNCMVTSDIRVKIGDFGLARDLYQHDYYRKTEQGPLPVRWMAPEALRDGVYGQASDVWSFGIVLWEMVTLAAQPYPGMTNEEVFEFVTSGGTMDLFKVKHSPTTFILLMQRCWLFSPIERPTFRVIRGCLPGEESAV